MSSIQAKLDLADDRPIQLVAKAFQELTGAAHGPEYSSVIAKAKDALDLYDAREISMGEQQERNLVEHMSCIITELKSIEESMLTLNESLPDFGSRVNEAETRRSERVEYNEMSRVLNEKRTREDYSTEISSIENELESLRALTLRSQRLCEYRRNQLKSIVYWTNVLTTGSLDS
jgi:chromosome segregation ATPase